MVTLTFGKARVRAHTKKGPKGTVERVTAYSRRGAPTLAQQRKVNREYAARAQRQNDAWRAQQLERAAIMRPRVRAWLKQLGPVPKGFTFTRVPLTSRPSFGGEFTLIGETPTLGKVSLQLQASDYGLSVDGTYRDVIYLGRTGVDVWKMFELDQPGPEMPTLQGLVDLLNERHARATAFEASAIRITLPQGGWSVSPEGLARIKADLAAGKIVSYHPSSFGIGYHLRTRRPLVSPMSARYGGGGEVTDPATLAALGQSEPVYWSSFDAD